MEFQLAASVSTLSQTPAIMRSLLSGLDEDWTHANYGPQTWSPHQIVGHLIWGERTDWIPRTRQILAEGRRRSF
ncbi:MAG: hypothetical protein MPJ50_02135 [Pirellulales bacterium]|nr:hypothetical protein [Pirellulales bacterium]